MDPSLLFLVVLLVFAFILFQRGNRQRRELAQVQRDMAPGAEVMMASGLFATITALDGDVVTVETGPGQTSRWDRRAVARIVGAAPAAEPGTDSDEAAVEAGSSTDEPA